MDKDFTNEDFKTSNGFLINHVSADKPHEAVQNEINIFFKAQR